uniref:Uncharacterized protein n=1 Tax=Trypanosoma congolense (strain IL3000) TaxID=1068625 RepID=G0UZP3_TRYCI|nr:hypothetical protein, unlikely [Trypanosoma congolense IL3000]
MVDTQLFFFFFRSGGEERGCQKFWWMRESQRCMCGCHSHVALCHSFPTNSLFHLILPPLTSLQRCGYGRISCITTLFVSSFFVFKKRKHTTTLQLVLLL